jgi:site-specific DNA recombinase
VQKRTPQPTHRAVTASTPNCTSEDYTVQYNGRVRIAIYMRISTDEEHQPFSLGAQAERLDSYVRSQDGWEVVRRFTDQMSGSTVARPQLQRALAEARLGRFDLLLVYRVDRLSRSVRGLAQVLEDLDQANVVFRSATEPFDTGSPAGRMMVQMLGVFAEFERATIIDRVIAGMERKAARGGWLGGTIPFGYRRNPETDTLEPEESEAPLVPVLYDLYVNKRLGCRAVANWLNERGHRTREGRNWSHMTTMTVLRNETYLGRVNFRGKVYAATHPPLIEESTFNAVEALLTERGENYSRRRSNPSNYLLGGLLTCAHCGSKFIGTAARGNRYQYRYYTCHRRNRYGVKGCPSERLPAEELDQAILAAMLEAYSDSDLVTKALVEARGRATAAIPQLKEQLAAVETDIRKTEESLERYFVAFEAGTMDEATCADRVETLTRKLSDLRCDRVGLQNVIETEAQLPAREEIEEILAEIRLMITDGTREDHKTLTQALVARTVVEGRHSIRPSFIVPTQKVRVLSRVVRLEGIEPPALRSGDGRTPVRPGVSYSLRATEYRAVTPFFSPTAAKLQQLGRPGVIHTARMWIASAPMSPLK